MTALEAYILARAYAKALVEGAGALKGAPCQIQSITPITGGNRITFAWETSEGETETDTLDVMDGVDGTNGTDGTDGTDGVGISSITFKEKDASGNNVYTVTLTNTNTYDITCPIGPQGETGATGATGATGNGIASIAKTGTSGLVDTYTITYTNGQTTTFTVTNGQTPTVDSAMSDSSENPVQNKIITAALATKTNQSQLATVEASTTASKAYSANEYLVLGGVLYKVTANIAQGGTIVTEGAGKNVDLATVGSELNAINSNLSSKVGIATATDLNGEKSIGVKTFTHTATGTPANHSGSALCMFQSDSYGMQIAQSSSENEAYIRFFNTDTWSGWDKIVKNGDLTNALNFTIYGTPDNAPFAENASGVSYAIKLGGLTLGYLTIRPKGYLGSQNKPVAMELYDSSWGFIWMVLRDAT